MHGNIYRAANLVLIHSRREVVVSSVTQTDSKLLVRLHSPTVQYVGDKINYHSNRGCSFCCHL